MIAMCASTGGATRDDFLSSRRENPSGIMFTAITLNRDSNLDIPIICSLVYRESSALGYVDTEADAHENSPERDPNLNLPILGSRVQHETSALANYATNMGPTLIYQEDYPATPNLEFGVTRKRMGSVAGAYVLFSTSTGAPPPYPFPWCIMFSHYKTPRFSEIHSQFQYNIIHVRRVSVPPTLHNTLVTTKELMDGPDRRK
uniref:(California timema) hypothetical protein n=1 Tax=Timema californicum TaxID=61474 RepID=A0A7R9JE21_TIMCA|nr:unnamed protein product [Timema californicum]